jgi:signal transduction histidine kinase
VAALVGTAGPPEDILTAICRAASDQLDGQEITLLRFESSDTIVAVATHGGGIPQGLRVVHPPGSLSDRVARTRRPVRIDQFESAPSAEIVQKFGMLAGVGVPIFIEGHVWGMFAATSQTGPLPADTEARLESFAQLTWAAIANSDARESLNRLAHEQAALRYVAELVAREASVQTVLEAAVKEATLVLDGSSGTVAQDDDDGASRIVASAHVRPDSGTHHADAPIFVNGRQWGTLTVTSAVTGHAVEPGGLKPFADLIAAAIANADHREGLTQSRARLIAAADEARRRLQRDVHDGAQQRLVHTIILLKLARSRTDEGGDVSELVAEALTNAEDANQQLRDVVRGILPAALTRAGLAAAIESLAAHMPLPVDLHLDLARLPTAIETTGYFAVAEAITNAVKHAEANRITVTGALANHGAELILTIEDDGVGGADPSRGTGLTGLADRIEASNGTIVIASPAQHGTRITARIPVQTPVDP